MTTPEIHSLDNDVFDPAGGDRLHILGRNLATPSSVFIGPTPATNVKEITSVPRFDGVTQRLNSATTLASYVGAGAWSFVALVRSTSPQAFSTNDADPKIFSDSGSFFALEVDTLGARIYVFDGAQKVSPYVALGPGLNLVYGFWDGTKIYLGANGGALDAGTACGAPSTTTGTMHVGCNYNATSFFAGDIVELMLSDANLSASLTNLIAYTNNRYGTNFGGIAASTFNPGTLALTGWWRSGGGYASGTWGGVLSAGPSAGRSLTEATNPPTVAPSSIVCTVPAGTANATVPAYPVFDGVDDELDSALTMNNFIATNAYCYWILFWVDGVVGANSVAAAFNDESIIADDGGWWGVSLYNNSGVPSVIAWHNTSGNTHVLNANAWNLLCVRADGTNVYSSLNGGPILTAANGNVTLTGALRMAKGWSGLFAKVRVREAGIMATAESNTRFTDIAGYINKRYGTTFGAIAPSTFDPATLSLTGWWRAGGYTLGTWTGTASAGASGSRSLTVAAASAKPRVRSTEPNLYPVTVVAAAGTGTLSRAVQYANPKALPDCVWWMRPDAGAITNSGGVTAWADQSGVGDTGRNGAPVTADKPPYNAADRDYGGKPTIGTFNGVGDFRLKTGVWSTTYSQPYTIGAIGHAHTDGRYFVNESSSDYNALASSSGLIVYGGTGSPLTLNPAGLRLDLPRANISGVWANASSEAHAEAYPPASGALGASNTLGDVGMSVGSWSGANSAAWGVERVAEVYAYSRALTGREHRTLRRYRDSYYGAAA